MSSNLNRARTTIITATLAILAFLLPLLFLSTTLNFFESNKLVLLIAATAIVVLTWLTTGLINQNLQLTRTPLTPPLVLFALVIVASTFITQPNPVDALVGKGLILPLLAALTLAATSALPSAKKTTPLVIYSQLTSASLLAILILLQSFDGAVAKIINTGFNLTLPETAAFSPAGSPLAAASVLAPTLVLSLTLAVTSARNRLLFWLASLAISIGLILSIHALLPGKTTSLVTPNYKTSYTIAVKTLDGPIKTLLLGYGPEAYANAYTQGKPVTVNLTDHWDTRFTTARSEIFTLITTTGLLGLASWLFLVSKWLKSRSADKTNQTPFATAINYALAVSLLLHLLVPATLLLLTTTYLFFLLWLLELKADKRFSKNLSFFDTTKIPTAILGLPKRFVGYLASLALASLIILILVATTRAYAAEVTFKRSLTAAQNSKIQESYQLQRDAIIKNRYIAGYRKTFSGTNLALANAVAGKPNLSDEDKTAITQLIQQSIAEAKAAVALDDQNAANWENLARIYQNLLNVAKYAHNWAIAAYTQAIRVDPTNPRLRLEVGAIYLQIRRFDEAIRLFQQAAELKPNWANAYYNLAAAYKQKGELDNALAALQTTLSLLKPDSADYATAKSELDDLRQELGENPEETTDETVPETTTESDQEILSTPSPLPSPRPEGLLELPLDAGTASPSAEAEN